MKAVASLWLGERLSFLEQVVLQSWIDNGYSLSLYAYDEVDGVPEQVDVLDASEIMGRSDISDARDDEIFRDIFRIKCLAAGAGMWIEMNALCTAPLPEGDIVFSTGSDDLVSPVALRLAPEHPMMAEAINFLDGDPPIMPWRGPRFMRKMQEQIAAGQHWTLKDLRVGATGPLLLSHMLGGDDMGGVRLGPKQVRHAPESEGLYLASLIPLDRIEPDGTCIVVLPKGLAGVIETNFYGLPPKTSYLDAICRRHAINPVAAPIMALAA